MAISDEVLLQFMQQTTAAVTASATKIENMEKRLFGNGQPGIIEKLYEHGESLATAHATALHEHVEADAQRYAEVHDSLTKFQAWRKSDKRVAKVVVGII